MNYAEFYKEVRKYATNYASRLFRNGREEAVDKAMDILVDRILKEKVTLSLAKRIVHDSLINIFRTQDLESVCEREGMTIYQPVNKNKNLKVRLDQISRPREKEIMTLYSKGMRQANISRELNVSRQYISKVVKKWTI